MSVQVELIIGCMMSGKSTELMRRINRFKTINKRVLYIRPLCDTREGLTHDGEGVNIVHCSTIELLDIMDEALEYDVVLIDEVQFFGDAVAFLKMIERHVKNNITLIFCGLSGDSERKEWPVVSALIPLSDKLTLKHALCVYCADGTKASYSICCVDKKNKLLIGDSEQYRAVCRAHYLDFTKVAHV